MTNKENLEASNQLFIELVEEIHKRGMKMILDGVFNHCGSFNKWLDRERIYENQPGYERVRLSAVTVRIITFSSSITNTAGLTMNSMTAGGGIIRFKAEF